MEERLNRLKEFVEELRGDSFGEQYGYVDFVESSPKLKEKMDKLSAESSFYQEILCDIENFKGIK